MVELVAGDVVGLVRVVEEVQEVVAVRGGNAIEVLDGFSHL